MKKSFVLVCLLIVALVFTMTASAAKVTTITYGRWASMEEAKAFQALIDKFEKENPNIKVQAEFLPWNAYWDKLKTTIMSGTAYDVISFSHLNSAPYVTKGALYEMSKLKGAKELLNEMQPGTKSVGMYKGKMYGIPVGVGVRAMIYNKEMFDEAGIPYPSSTKPYTWEEFVQVGKKLTKTDAEGKVTQYACNLHVDQCWVAIVDQAGGSFLDNYSRPTKVTINTPAGIAGLTYFADLFKNKINVPFSDQWNGPWGSPDSAVCTKKVAMVLTGPWSISSVQDAKVKFGTAPSFGGKKRSTFGYINLLAISKDSKKAQAAWTFINWICSAKGQLEFTKTGDLPANSKALTTAMKNPVQFSSEIMDAYYSELPYVITGPMLPSEEFNTVTNNIIHDMVEGRITPAEAAKKLESEGNAVIKKIFAE
jgi:multiple sugar transport system substrate-binding protein